MKAGWPYLVLMVAVLVTYGQILGHDFVAWDDPTNVISNPYLQDLSWENVGRFWRETYFTRYSPLSYMLYSAEAWLAQLPSDAFGKKSFNPAVFHAGSLLLHLACVLCVYRLLAVFTGPGMPACVGALLFGLHPLQAETVCWVSGQGGLLSTVFSLLALIGHLRNPAGLSTSLRPGRLSYSAATLAYLGALLAKPTAVCVPLIAIVLDRFVLKRSWKASVLLLSPWLLMAIGAILINRWQPADVEPRGIPLPLWARPFIAGDALSFYLIKILWPTDLMIQYPRSAHNVLGHPWTYVAWLLPAVVLGLCYRFRAHGPWLTCGGWFVAALAPVLGMLQFDYQHFSTVADRYVYLALVAPALAAAWWVAKQRSPGILALACLMLVLLAGAGFRQAGYWRDSESLFTRTIQLNPNSQVARGGLACDLISQGRYSEALQQMEASFRIDLLTLSELDYLNRARALLGLNRTDEAIDIYRQALTLHPDSAAAHQNIAAAYIQKQDWASAIRHARRALDKEPDNMVARFNLSLALDKAGQYTEAIEQFREVLLRSADYHPARLKLGMLLAAQGKREEAKDHFRYILSRQDDPSAHAELARALIEEGDPHTAVRHLEQALQQDSPVWAAIASRLAWLRATHPSPQVRDGRQAVALAEQACRLTGFQRAEHLQSLAAALAETGDFDQAVATAKKASELAAQNRESPRASEIQEQLGAYSQRRPYRTAREGR